MSVATTSKPFRLYDAVTITFLSVAWGLAWPATIIGLRTCDPLLLASLRSIVGGVVLFAWRLHKGNRERFGLHDFWITFVAGTCWIGIPMAFTSWALQYISGGLGAILQSTVPFFVAIFAYFILKEKQVSFAKIVGLVLGFGGIIVLFSDKTTVSISAITIAASLAVLIPSGTNGFAQVYARKHFKGNDQLGFMMYILFISGLETLPFCFIGGLPHFGLNLELTGSILYLGLIATAIPFVLYFEMLQRVDIVLLSMIAYIIPVVAIVVGVIWLDERVSAVQIAGSILVILGVILATQFDLVKSKIASRQTSSRAPS